MNQILDSLLLEGTRSLSPGLRDRIADYVVSLRSEDGGYPGRFGNSDPYYTDFALRILFQTRSEEIRHPTTCEYAQWNSAIANIPECLNRISIANLCDVSLPLMAGSCLNRYRVPSKCFSREAHSSMPSAYHTFLGSICEDMLGLMHQTSKESLQAILKLQRSDGGFVDTGADENAQTNPTAAASSYLLRAFLLESPLTEEEENELEKKMNGAAEFLMRMQAREGGFLACANAFYPDLLSTFTALATLMALDRANQLDLKSHVRFVGSLADANGGFRSCAIDAEQDIEYTYYGLGCLALISMTAKTA
jgi:geranylgeranyl transferase type-2 subunit beta